MNPSLDVSGWIKNTHCRETRQIYEENDFTTNFLLFSAHDLMVSLKNSLNFQDTCSSIKRNCKKCTGIAGSFFNVARITDNY